MRRRHEHLERMDIQIRAETQAFRTQHGRDMPDKSE
jgi:hypothetical protein